MLSNDEIKAIELKYNELLKSCKPFIQEDKLALIQHAFDYAVKVQKDEISDPGIVHALSIAKIATEEIGLGSKSITATLLHNIMDSGHITQDHIKQEFGKTVAVLVDGYSRLSQMPTDRISLQSEKFRQLFLTLIDDIRVILIKLAHRVYDMRIIDQLPGEKQIRFTNEVVHLYIPIAHRLGLYRVKSELEDRYMKFAHQDIYGSIQEKLNVTRSKRTVFIEEFKKPIEDELMRNKIDFDIKGRPKSIPSIWDKMKRQDVELEQVYDLFAIRIILDSKPENEKAVCWKVYSIVTNIYPPNPKRLRDWISSPKASGYESLHTTVQGPNDKWVEIQIRTRRMDEIAEKGQAAHWRYKGFDHKKDTDIWLAQVRDILEYPEQIKFDDPINIEKKADKIFIYTPDGDLKELPPGSTVLDFAYEVHTRVGDTCNGAKVNNQAMPIRHVLKNGDKVEIITSKTQKPKQDWLKFVKTTKARNKIKRALKEDKFKEAETGNEILRRKLKNWKLQFTDDLIGRLVKQYKLSSSIDLYGMIAEEKLDLNEIKKFLLKKKEEQSKTKIAEVKRVLEAKEKTSIRKIEPDALVIDDKLDKVNYKLGRCCNPIAGDKVFGFVTIGKGITIHRVNCPNAKRLLENYGYRKIRVTWKDTDQSLAYQTTIKVTGQDKMGMLEEITNVISKDLRVNMNSIKVESRDGVFLGFIKIQVNDSKHLDELLHKLSKIKGVSRASRIET
ncbi:MAG: RelA/SpoT family protein [Bacteroidota bacterium]|nr:RelA/SpoT family protein [Bacteroidota bacterium]